MKKISIEDHYLLTESVLKTLAQNRITTISEFLQEDTEKLSIISAFNLREILDIRAQLLSTYSAPLVEYTTLLNKTLNNCKFIPSGIKSLDATLEGGIHVGCITELCGLAGSGKTQICFQSAINCAKSEYAVLYIDTKGDFSAVRIMNILEAQGCNYEQMATIMSKIKIVHIWTLKDAIELLKILKIGTIVDFRLLIIDSLPCLTFQHLDDDNKIGLTLLNELVNNLRFIAKELIVAVICVNIQTRWLDHDITDFDDDKETNSVTRDTLVERRNRCLGKYWQHIPSMLLVIERLENKNSQIQVKVYNSRLPRQFQQCTLKFDDIGTINTM